MDALAAFDAQIHVPSISKLRHLDLVLRQVDLFQEEGSQERAIELLKQAQLNESGKLLIGIKRLLAIVEMAKQVSGVLISDRKKTNNSKQDPHPAEKFATTLINSL